jgi:hypothetical protein
MVVRNQLAPVFHDESLGTRGRQTSLDHGRVSVNRSSPVRCHIGVVGCVARWKVSLVLGFVVSLWLMTGVAQASGESVALGYDVIGQAERVLKYAAENSPHWASNQDSIERGVYDITFFLEQAWRASENANDVAMKEYAHQALTLLQRAVMRGYFSAEQVEPVMTLIRRLLPNVLV